MAWGLARISSREIAEWRAYCEIEPFGDKRADLRSAAVASVIANVNRDPKVRSEPFVPEDFVLKFEKKETDAEVKRQPWEQQLQIVEMLNAAFGGADERRTKI